MATLYKTDGSQEDVQPANGADFSLAEMRQLVGGSVEIVRIGLGQIMLVNEDGLGLGLPLNGVGVQLYRDMAIRNGHAIGFIPIVGDVVVCLTEEVK